MNQELNTEISHLRQLLALIILNTWNCAHNMTQHHVQPLNLGPFATETDCDGLVFLQYNL